MEIKFEKLNGVYTAEFEITSNCNIHIEREELGMFTIESRGSKSGKYVPMEEGHYGDKYIIDVDMLGNIYPKYIKITSASKPTYAEVNFAQQGGGSGGEDIVYYNMTGLDSKEIFAELLEYTSLIKVMTTDNSIVIVPPFAVEQYTNETGSSILGIKINYSNMIHTPEIEGLLSLEEVFNIVGISKSILQPCITTKEEFYNLEA